MNKVAVAAAGVLVCLIEEDILMKRRKRKRKIWVKHFISKRSFYDVELKLMADLLGNNDNSFQNFTRIPYYVFEKLHDKVEFHIKKKNTFMREAISSKVKLAVALRFIASGDSYASLEYLSRISRSTISLFIPEVLKAIYNELKYEHLKIPNTQEDWEEIAKDFNEILHFPNIIGAIDGKHIDIQSPSHSGSYFFNYKHRFSIVLLAMVDAKGNFLYVDVGCNGRISDGGIFKNSSLYTSLKEKTLNLPIDKPLPGRYKPIPHMIIGDNAFALSNQVLKSFPKARCTSKETIFNYRLAHCRNIVERTFGRLASRFRIFLKPINLKLENIENMVLTCCALHNFLNCHDPLSNFLNEPICFRNIAQQGSNHSSQEAYEIRDEFANYFMNEGSMNFQWHVLA